MADTTTTHYSFVKPEVGASTDTWGTKLNTDLDAIDAQLKVASDAAAAAVASVAARIPLAGSAVITGDLGFTRDNARLNFLSPNSLRGYGLRANVTNAATGIFELLSFAGSSLLSVSELGDVLIARRLAAAGTIRATGISDATAGTGTEVYYDPAGRGYLVAVDRATLSIKAMRVYGNPLELFHDGAVALTTSSTGIAAAGTIADATGNVRRPGSRLLASTGDIVAGDMNAIIEKSAAGAVSATLVTALGQRGDIVTLVNSSTSGNLTIARSGTTLFQNGVNADIVVAPGSLVSIVRADTANVWVA